MVTKSFLKRWLAAACTALAVCQAPAPAGAQPAPLPGTAPMAGYAPPWAPWLATPPAYRGAAPPTAYGQPVAPQAHAELNSLLSMFHPHWYGQWLTGFANPWVDQMTQKRLLDTWMRSMDPKLMFGQPRGTSGEDGDGQVPDRLPLASIPGFPTQTKQAWRPNTVCEGVSLEAKRNFYQSMMMLSPLSMRDMVSIMAEKMPVAEGVTFEDAVDAMKLRANEVNFKLVGHNAFWLDVRAITGDQDTPRVEIFQFCDAMVGRQILDYVPEFAVFLPCRIALLEDADRKLWVMTLDWDVGWLDYAQNPNSELDKGLRAEAHRLREAIRYIMEGAATGDF